MTQVDSDLAWLRSYAPEDTAPPLQRARVQQLHKTLTAAIAGGRLPFTIGMFGGWGTGKTTTLGLLANRILDGGADAPRVIYFNAWKYAGFMEIVPSLIYKVLKYGNHPQKDIGARISAIMLSLGKAYADRLGGWAAHWCGFDPTEVARETYEAVQIVRDGIAAVPPKVVDAYYTQIDQAQDLLASVFSDPKRVTVVLVDELDRCDPDEAFAVIKQLRVFFAMRNLPIAFVICANPEPIGLSVRHKFGLHDAGSDYENRLILEKFIDIYVDMTEPLELGSFVRWLWEQQKRNIGDHALVHRLDELYVKCDPQEDTMRNVTALQAITSDNPMYANLRLLRKTFERVCSRRFSNSHMLWTAWHLELAEQMDQPFRRDIATTSLEIRHVAIDAYRRVFQTPLDWAGNKLRLQSNPEGTVFCAYRSAFWEAYRARYADIKDQPDPELRQRATIMGQWMRDYRRMEFLALLSLLPAAKPDARGERGARNLSAFLPGIEETQGQFGWLLANY
ncbi:KAP family P-loop NTPase fold protein [Paracraurococcus lichenis]|uniref:P-loop NTPase fold protein n=1 Tax=Paracraurococcus lichenis TaxID=3064888 RepID=A0ABT9E397_9PROT|nr:P-loop NTPase fold protein [Paracraurococcus sp. LOR1-02]MDO9710636.1 P-loop NTPase fold protein [Paracraurococcus sp. LOR1-02]